MPVWRCFVNGSILFRNFARFAFVSVCLWHLVLFSAKVNLIRNNLLSSASLHVFSRNLFDNLLSRNPLQQIHSVSIALDPIRFRIFVTLEADLKICIAMVSCFLPLGQSNVPPFPCLSGLTVPRSLLYMGRYIISSELRLLSKHLQESLSQLENRAMSLTFCNQSLNGLSD